MSQSRPNRIYKAREAREKILSFGPMHSLDWPVVRAPYWTLHLFSHQSAEERGFSAEGDVVLGMGL